MNSYRKLCILTRSYLKFVRDNKTFGFMQTNEQMVNLKLNYGKIYETVLYG